MEIRQAFPNEIGAIMTVIESARTALAEAGSTQWQGADGYPTEETIFDDVLKGQAYVGLIDGQIVSYAAVVADGLRLRVKGSLKPLFKVLLRELMPMIFVATHMKRILSCSIFWRNLAMSILARSLLMVNVLLIRKSKPSVRKPFIKKLMKQLTTGYIDLRGIKLWYLV